MKEKTMKILIAVLAVLLLAGVTAYAATSYGTRDDPLITKSYLDDVVRPQLERELQTKLDDAASDLLRSAPGEFQSVLLRRGDSLQCAVGCQILPVNGTFTADGAMVDTTLGLEIEAGTTLSLNHLYLATEDAGVTASGAATVLLSGSWRAD